MPRGCVLKLCTSLSCVHASHSCGSITVSIMRTLCTLCTLRNPPACSLCRSVLSDSYRTPLHIMHPPHIVALGALCLAATITQLDLRSWLNGLDADFAAVSWTLTSLFPHRFAAFLLYCCTISWSAIHVLHIAAGLLHSTGMPALLAQRLGCRLCSGECCHLIHYDKQQRRSLFAV